jgi:aspartate carbamoyltransferase regulatory subunit
MEKENGTLIQNLQREWHQLEQHIQLVSNLITEPQGENTIISLAEEIRIMNAFLQRLTIRTLNTMLHVAKDFDICPRCHQHMDILGNDLVCENPLCPTNEYIHGELFQFRRREGDRRAGERRHEKTIEADSDH